MNETAASHKYEILLMILIAGFIGIFLYTVHTMLSPILVFIAILILAFPLRRHPAVKTVLFVLLLVFVAWFFDTMSSVLAPAFIAFLLAYILDPLVDWLVNKKIPRLLAVISITLIFLAIVVTAFLLLVPAIINSFQGFNPQKIGNDIQYWISSILMPKLVSYGIRESDIQNFVNTKILPHIESILTSLLGSLANLAIGLTTILGQVVNAIIIPILMFYILLDWDRIKAWVVNLFPIQRRETARKYYHKINHVMSAYLRGALIIAIINTIVVTTIFTIIGIPFSIVLGILSGLFTLIPQFGVLITMAISVLISLFGPSPGLHIVLALVILLAENLLESSVLYPKIVGKALGLHPAALIISLLIFAYFFGFIGMLIAVPVTSLLVQFLDEWMQHRDANAVE